MSATYPTGFGLYNNRQPFPYVSWKGQGLGANPIGVSSGNIRPQTNQDPLNNAIYKQGQARPQKTYRKGTSIVIPPTVGQPLSVKLENTYYSNRTTKSSTSGNLVSQLIDTPGRFIVKPNIPSFNASQNLVEGEGKQLGTDLGLPETTNSIGAECQTCSGMGVVSSWYPINNLSENPEPNVTNPGLCCNQEYKAKKRVLPANTNLPKNYYTTHSQYLYNRCQTYEQRAFNFCGKSNLGDVGGKGCGAVKAGSPLAATAYYVANCNPNGIIVQGATTTLLLEILQYLVTNKLVSSAQSTAILAVDGSTVSLAQFVATLRQIGATNPKIFTYLDAILTNPYSGLSNYLGTPKQKSCARVYYKPNNYTFAQQGAVSSSTRTLQQKSQTIETNASSFTKTYGQGAINQYGLGNTLSVLKTKTPRPNPALYTRDGHPRICNPATNDIQNPSNSVYDFTNLAND
jgi:hypothetical protein